MLRRWKLLCSAFAFLTLSFCASGQAYKSAIGSTYRHLNELPFFGHCIVLESRVNDCNLVCKRVVDTLNFKTFLVAEQIADGKEDRRKLLDVLQIWAAYPEYMTLIGSLETKEGQKNSAFLIAVELENGKLESNGVLPVVSMRSTRIFKAWQIHCRQKKFVKYPLKDLYRIHEGFYVRSAFAPE